ncbi:SsgA family sporulation/cell division regulator [Streptomyces sp. TLI_171]|uniref:SsgA family sporulation/cell division regulator n=1 Tax=Streptomyces sp. TLI_171 TaxID=1938859 RepID=UPI000C19D993|nr:SsgA family sporulation/cell division regulator [Streptomyces sp. TLI_171]RKE23609.1 sporulation and cell division protein SsgA [Streptomyces sp. TLI_171]
MNGDRARRPVPDDVPVLRLVLKRVLEGCLRRPVRAEFRFDRDSPMVVSVALAPTRGPSVTWRIGRGLLYQGLFEESGEGRVQVWPALGREGGTAMLRLESRESSALLEVPVPPLAGWLEDTYAALPAEAELDALDWDGFVAGVLGGRRPTGEC